MSDTPADDLREQMEDVIDNRRFEDDFPNSLNFNGIQYCVEQLLPFVEKYLAQHEAKLLESLMAEMPEQSGAVGFNEYAAGRNYGIEQATDIIKQALQKVTEG